MLPCCLTESRTYASRSAPGSIIPSKYRLLTYRKPYKIMTHSFIVRIEPCSKLQMNSLHSTMETQEYAKMRKRLVIMSCLMKNLHNQMCQIFYQRQKEGNKVIIFILILGISLDHQGITESWEASTGILENSGIIQIKLKVKQNYYLLL